MVFVAKEGSTLNQDEIEVINHYRRKEFGSSSDINPKRNNRDWGNVFFLSYGPQDKLLAFGKVEKLTISHTGKQYMVLCVSTVVATQKGRGYGTQIMEHIKIYAQNKGKTLIGFCETRMLPFYQKCGFTILSREDNQFVYSDSEGNITPNDIPGEVFFADGKDTIMTTIMSGTDKLVRVIKKV